MDDPAKLADSSPPRSAIAAIALVGLTLALAPARSAAMGGWDQPLVKGAAIVMLTLICVAWILGLCRRIRWLRWLTVICGGFGLLAIPSLAASDTLGLQSALYLVQCVTLVIASVLLLLPSASAWFGSKSKT